MAAGPELNAGTALTTARTVAAQIKDARVLAVAANKEMRSIFEGDAYVIVEPARVEALRIGDMVTYEDPVRHEVVVRRVLDKHAGTLAAMQGAGDSLRRVFAIIYYRGEGSALDAASLATSSPAPVKATTAAAAAEVR